MGRTFRAITAFGRSSDGGLIVPGSALAAVHRNQIATLAARNKLLAIYFNRFFVTAGGLISYDPISSTSTDVPHLTSTAAPPVRVMEHID